MGYVCNEPSELIGGAKPEPLLSCGCPQSMWPLGAKSRNSLPTLSTGLCGESGPLQPVSLALPEARGRGIEPL
jgi:hypothetical protein